MHTVPNAGPMRFVARLDIDLSRRFRLYQAVQPASGGGFARIGEVRVGRSCGPCGSSLLAVVMPSRPSGHFTVGRCAIPRTWSGMVMRRPGRGDKGSPLFQPVSHDHDIRTGVFGSGAVRQPARRPVRASAGIAGDASKAMAPHRGHLVATHATPVTTHHRLLHSLSASSSTVELPIS